MYTSCLNHKLPLLSESIGPEQGHRLSQESLGESAEAIDYILYVLGDERLINITMHLSDHSDLLVSHE